MSALVATGAVALTDIARTKRSVGNQTVVWEGANPLEGKTDTGSPTILRLYGFQIPNGRG